MIITNTEAGLDWLTATTRERSTGLDWYSLFERYSDQQKRDRPNGYPVDYARMRQYHGRRGQGLYWGHDPNTGWIIIASGSTASRLWTDITPVVGNVTRLDMQTTIELAKQDVMVAKRAYSSRKPDRRNRRYSFITNSQGGSTVYVGSRKSKSSGRLYDKGAQLGNSPGYQWRYEVEIKDPKSNSQIISHLYSTWSSDGPVLADIVGYIREWFILRGVAPIFGPTPGTAIHIDTSVSATSNDRQLEWLRTQVSPTIARLLDEGLYEQTFKALGLTYDQIPLWADVEGGVVTGDNSRD